MIQYEHISIKAENNKVSLILQEKVNFLDATCDSEGFKKVPILISDISFQLGN